MTVTGSGGVSALIEQKKDRTLVACIGGTHQRGPSMRIPLVDILASEHFHAQRHEVAVRRRIREMVASGRPEYVARCGQRAGEEAQDEEAEERSLSHGPFCLQ